MITFKKLLFAWVLLFFANNVLAVNRIQQIRSNSLPEKLQIVIDVESKPKFSAFALSNPTRLVVDIDGLAAPGYKNKSSFKNRGVTLLRTGIRNKKALRVVMDLKHSYHWEVYALTPENGKGDRVIIDVYDQSSRKFSKSGIVKAPSQQTKPLTLQLESENTRPVRTSKSPVISLDSLKTPHKVSSKNTVVYKTPTHKTITVTTTPVVAKETTAKVPKQNKIIVVIDPGHGGKDSGARGPHKTQEKVVVLQIAKRLKRKIDALPNMKAILTRSSDRYITLRGRLNLARKYKADLFVSIHADAFRSPQAKGSSVFILSNRGASSEAARWLARRENSVDLKYGIDIGGYDKDISNVLMQIQQDATIESSYILANKTLGQLKSIGKVHKKRVERAGFVVLKSPDIPSMLVETAFISNPSEEKRLKSPIFQEKLAKAITKGIQRYFQAHLPHHLLLVNAPKP